MIKLIHSFLRVSNLFFKKYTPEKKEDIKYSYVFNKILFLCRINLLIFIFLTLHGHKIM